MKNLRGKSVEDLKKTLSVDRLIIYFFLIITTVVSLISFLFAYSLDPVLSLVSISVFLIFITLFLLILYTHKNLYKFIRELSE